MPESHFHPDSTNLVKYFRQSLSPMDRKLFDDWFEKAKKRIPLFSQSDIFQLISLLFSAQVSLLEELNDLKSAQDPKEPENGRYLPFGESGYSFFSNEQVNRFRSMGLDVNDPIEPTYGPLEE